MKFISVSAPVFRQRLRLVAAALSLFLSFASAQVSERITAFKAEPYQVGMPMTITVELSNVAGIDHIEFGYRQFGKQVYSRREMILTSTTATLTIPAEDLAPPFLEYFIVFFGPGGIIVETYPLSDPENHPYQIPVEETETSQNDIIILSPEENEKVLAEDVVISFSLLRTDSTVNPQATKIFIDGADVSSSAVISNELVIINADNNAVTLSPGSHTIRVDLFNNDGALRSTTSWAFIVRGFVDQPFIASDESYATWKYRGSAQLETRNENISNAVTPYNRATLSASASSGDFIMNGRLYLTNEEDSRRQPQNRYFIGAEYKWIKLGYGDTYPVFSDMIMTGRRVRGLNGNLSVGPFSLDVILGDITRHIDTDILKIFPVDSLASEQQRDSLASFILYDSTSATHQWAKIRYGTFDRNLFVISPTFGRADNRIRFTYLKSKDDIESIRYGVKPQENAVFGTDLLLTFDRRNIEITGQAAVSMTNNDITTGSLTEEEIYQIFDGSGDIDPDDVNDMRKYFSGIITVNEHLVPLSLKNTSTLAYDAGLALHYFDNSFRFTYLRHGESFQSFGQPFFRTDIKGYSITDRLRLADNQLLISGGYERLQDNTAQTKATTTTSQTGNIGVTYTSRTDVPSITVGYLLSSNDNEFHPDSLFARDDQTNRFIVQLIKRFVYGAQHTATLGFTTSSRDDKTVQNLDTRTTTVTLGNVSKFSIPLQTTLSLGVNSTEFSSFGTSQTATATEINYTTLYVNGIYQLIDNRLRLSGTVNPTFGDISRTLLDASAQYFFLTNLSLQSQLSIYMNKQTDNDIIWSFILRYDI
jgi:hypothetical protein